MNYSYFNNYGYFYDHNFECKMQKSCNPIGCEVHFKRLHFVEAKYPTTAYYIFHRQEIEEWSTCICRENRLICSACGEPDCFTCYRFYFIKNEFHEVGYFVARDWPWQPILWQIHEK